jgi:hypothetical protein
VLKKNGSVLNKRINKLSKNGFVLKKNGSVLNKRINKLSKNGSALNDWLHV